MEQTYENGPAPSEHMLDDLEYDVVLASSRKRLFNAILDGVASYLFFKFVLFKPLVSVLVSIREHGGSMTAIYVVDFGLVIGYYILYYAGLETLTGGKTLGKYVTGTVAVNEDGTRISFKTALLRSLIRMIPVEFLSAFTSPCYPWHDRWTDTYVADKRESILPTS